MFNNDINDTGHPRLLVNPHEKHRYPYTVTYTNNFKKVNDPYCYTLTDSLKSGDKNLVRKIIYTSSVYPVSSYDVLSLVPCCSNVDCSV